MDIEKEVVSYLLEYGDTRESDLVSWGTHKFDYSARGIKKVIERLVRDKKIFRVVHGQLRPPGVYFSVKGIRETDYSDLEPEHALEVSRIDWILENFGEIIGKDSDQKTHEQVISLLKLIRDRRFREGKALGR